MTDIKKRLEKKSTFEAAVRELTVQAKATGTTQQADELFHLCARVHALLKARYSNLAFWKAGRDLYVAALNTFQATSAAAAKLQAYLADAEAFLSTDSESSAPARQQTLGELLLGLPPPQEAPSHLSDAGLVLDHPAAGAAAAAAAAAATSTLQPQLTSLASAAAEQQQPEQLSIDELLQRIQQQHMQSQGTQHQQWQQQGQQQQAQLDEARMIELLAGELPRADLEELLSRLTAGAGAQAQNTRPPASKKVVASLPVLHLSDEAALKSVGGQQSSCPVCTEQLQLGDSVQQLPCTHVFHVPCLAPWLQQHNSCPMCRHELPTDDHAYEARKEREAEEEEARRGAANALSHAEFMWI